MYIDLNKKALISLVMGKDPNYELFDHPMVKVKGRYSENSFTNFINYVDCHGYNKTNDKI